MTASPAPPSRTDFAPRGDLPQRIPRIIEAWVSGQADARTHAWRPSTGEADGPGIGRFHLSEANPAVRPEPTFAGDEQVAAPIYPAGTPGAARAGVQ